MKIFFMSHNSILTQRVYRKLLPACLRITICHVTNDYFCITFNKVNFIENSKLLQRVLSMEIMIWFQNQIFLHFKGLNSLFPPLC